jgi:hypothetical protein
MKVGVTGTVDVDLKDIEVVISALRSLDKNEITELTTGGAFGIDSIAAQVGHHEFPDIIRRLSYPKGEFFNRDCFQWINVVDPVDGGYMKRNDRIVFHSDILFAFPKTSIEQKRSGTWATVRRARRKGIPIFFFPLNGAKPWQEGV